MERKQTEGIPLRDYFAAEALPAAYRDFWDDVRAGRNAAVTEDWRTAVAIEAYAMADAMLAVREKYALVSKRSE